VSRVTEATVASLRCALVEAHLQVEFTLVGAQLFFCECAFVLLSHLGAKSWASVLWVLLSESSERVEAQGDLRDVAALEQVSGLENFLFWDSVLLDGGLESMNSFLKLLRLSRHQFSTSEHFPSTGSLFRVPESS
jgi:hypothetical protein